MNFLAESCKRLIASAHGANQGPVLGFYGVLAAMLIFYVVSGHTADNDVSVQEKVSVVLQKLSKLRWA